MESITALMGITEPNCDHWKIRRKPMKSLRVNTDLMTHNQLNENNKVKFGHVLCVEVFYV